MNKSSCLLQNLCKLECISFHPSVDSFADKLRKQLDPDQDQHNFVPNLGSNFFALMTFVDDFFLVVFSGISILFLIHRRRKKDL